MQPIFIDLPMCEPAGEFLAPPIGGYGGDYCYAAPFLVRSTVMVSRAASPPSFSMRSRR